MNIPVNVVAGGTDELIPVSNLEHLVAALNGTRCTSTLTVRNSRLYVLSDTAAASLSCMNAGTSAMRCLRCLRGRGICVASLRARFPVAIVTHARSSVADSTVFHRICVLCRCFPRLDILILRLV